MAAGTKVGEVYAEVFVKINEASRKAAMAGVAAEMRTAFDDAFNDVDKRSTQSTNRQVNNNRKVTNSVKDADSFLTRFGKNLTKTGTQGESVMHRLATQTRTVGTLFRALSVGAKVIAGSNALLQAFQGLVAAVPIVQAGLLAIPALVAAAGVEALVLHTAFKGVGTAIKDAGTNTKQFNEDLKKLSPAAQGFVKVIAQVKKDLPNIQQNFFSAPQMREATSHLQGFFATLHTSIAKLATANGGVFGAILGTATNGAGAKLTEQFLNNITTILNRIRPGLSAITHGFQVLIAEVSGQGASRAKSLNGALEQFGNFLTHIDVKGIFDRASKAMAGFKTLAGLAWDIIKNIVKDLGGQQGVANDFFTTVGRYLTHIDDFVKSGSGKEFVQNIRSIVTALGTISASGASASLQLLGIGLQIIAPLLNAVAAFATAHPTAFRDIALGIGLMSAAWKIYRIAAAAARAIALSLDVALNANIIGLVTVAVIALGVGLFELVKHFDAVSSFLRGPWGKAVLFGIAVFMPFLLIPALLIAYWRPVLNFFIHTLPAAFSVTSGFLSGWGVNIKNWALNTVHAVTAAWDSVWRFFVVTLPGAARVLWQQFVRFGAIIVSNALAVAHAVNVAWTAVWNFFVKTIPGAAKFMWEQLIHYGAVIIQNALAVAHAINVAWTAVWSFFVKTIPGAAKVLWEQLVHWGGLIVQGARNTAGGIVAYWNTVLNFFRKDVPKAFNTFKSFLAGLWNTVESRIRAFCGRFVDQVKTIPGGVLKALRSVANDGFRTPVNWIIDHVYTHGIKALWNDVAGPLHLPKITAALGGLPKFASGGFVSGAGGPREDKIPAYLSNGEYVINAQTVSNLGTDFFNQLNNSGRAAWGDPSGVVITGKNQQNLNHRDGGLIQGFAKGGAVHQSPSEVLKFLRSIAGRVPYRLGANGPGAFDCSSLVGEVWARLTGHPHNRRYFVTGTENSWLGHHGFKKGAGNKKQGLIVGNTGEHTVGILNGHRFEAAHTGTKMRYDDGATNALSMPSVWHMATGAGGGFLTGILGKIWDLPKKMISFFQNPLNALIGKIPNVQGSDKGIPSGSIMGSVKNGILPAIVSKGTSLLSSGLNVAEAAAEKAFDALNSGLNFIAGSGGRPGNKQVADWIAAANIYTGAPSSWTKDLEFIIAHESGNNPNAQNNSDSNARAGHPSQGLGQLIPATFNANVPGPLRSRGIRDPIANIAAMEIYIKRRYGAPQNTPWFHGQTFYKDGGPVKQKLYDNGGILSPGYTLALNKTGKNEYVTKTPPGSNDVYVTVKIGEETIVDKVRGELNDFIGAFQRAAVTI